MGNLKSNMKITVFTTMTNPEKRNDPWKQALNCYEDIADEIVVKGSDWPEEFNWDHIGKTFNSGFIDSNGDWAIRMDLDYFFHHDDISKIYQKLKQNNDVPAVVFPQYQFFSPDRYQIKTLICIAYNKKSFPNIKLNGGGDLCLPTLDGKLLNPWKLPILDIPVWQYDSIFRTKKIISEDRARFARAWHRYFNDWGDRGGGDPQTAFEAWIAGIENKYKKHTFKEKINNHPKYIKESLLSLEDNQFGYDVFGLKNNTSFKLIDIAKGYKLKKTIQIKAK